MGPASLAGNLQGWFHKNISRDKVFDEWNFQIPNQPIINLSFTYAYDFMPNATWLNIFGYSNIQMGNLYANITPTVGIRLGKFNELPVSSCFDNYILASSTKSELYFQSTFGVTFDAFDATAQGNLFDQDFKYAVKSLNHINYKVSNSLHFSSRRIAASFSYIHTFGKIIYGSSHIYGSAKLAYRF